MADQPPPQRDQQPAPQGASLPVVEAEFDPAGQSLSQALMLSFRLLKGIMLLLLIGYVFSGTFIVDANEQAVVMTLGRIDEEPKLPGLHWSAPFPIAEHRLVPVEEKKTLDLDSFWFRVADADRDKPVVEMQARAAGLEPGVDGSLMTGDKNLVHMTLQVQYSVADAIAYVKNLEDSQQTLESVIAGAVESATIAAVGSVEVDEILRGQVEQIMDKVKRRAQATLDSLDCGIQLAGVIAVLKTWPLQTSPAFVRVQQAENEKLQKVEEANAEARQTLNAAAGPSHPVIAAKIDEYEAARQSGDSPAMDALDAEISTLLETVASGEAAKVISEGKAYKARIIQEVQAAAELFEDLLPQYRANPALVRETQWQDTLMEIFSGLSVDVYYIWEATSEIRVLVGKSKELQRLIREAEAKKETEK
jgi:membrane protease subunit HflK